MITKEQAIDILERFDFFQGQRTGRELWNDKPADIQNEDIDNFKRDVAFLEDFINRQKAELERLEYTLLGVMHSVDKWLDGGELKQNEVDRAATMREKTLQIIESKTAEIERLQKVIKVQEIMIGNQPLKLQSARNGAIKEFAERLTEMCRKARFSVTVTQNLTGTKRVVDKIPVVDESDIDNLVKEFTEGKDNGK